MSTSSLTGALVSAAEAFGTEMTGLLTEVAPVVFVIAAGVIGLRLVLNLFRSAI